MLKSFARRGERSPLRPGSCLLRMRPELPGRTPVPLLFLSVVLLAAGVWRHHGPATALFLAFALAGYLTGGYPGLLAVGVVVIACGSSSIASVEHSGLFLRWEALLLLGVVPLLAGTRILPLPPGITPVAGALAVWCMLSTAWSPARATTFERGATFAAVLWVGLIAVPAELRDFESRRRALVSLLAAGVLGCIIALLLGVADPSVGRPLGPLRGWLQNSNTVGLWAAALAPSVMVIRGRARVIAGALFLAVILWSQSRSALIVLLIFAVAYAVTHREQVVQVVRSRLMRGLAAGVAAVLVGLIALDPGGFVGHTALQKFTKDQSLILNLTGARSQAWSATASHLSLAPVEGLGFGTVEVDFQDLGIQQRFTYFAGNNSSDSYLQMFLETGLIGGCLFATLVLMLLAPALRAPNDSTSGAFAIMGISMAVAALVESILTSAGGPFAIIAWTGLGIAASGRTHPIGQWLAKPSELLSMRLVRPLAVLAPVVIAGVLVTAFHYKPVFDQPSLSSVPSYDGLVSVGERQSLERAAKLIPNGSQYLLFIPPYAVNANQYRLRSAAGLYLADKVPVRHLRNALWLLAWGAPGAATGLSTRASYALGNGFVLYQLSGLRGGKVR